ERILFAFQNPASTNELLKNFRSVDPLCPPLYAVSLNRWIELFGSSDTALRSLSLCFSIFSLLALMLFCRALLGTRTALLAGFLQAISPFDIHYAQEARMYSLVALNAVLSGGSLILLLKAELKSKKAAFLLPLYTISSWALLNSHYTALFLLATEALAGSAYLIYKRRWSMLAALSASGLLVVLLWLPWLPMFLQSAASRKESFYVARKADLIWPLKGLLRIFINWLIFLSGQRVYAAAAGIYASSALLLALSVKTFFGRDAEKRFELGALFLWAAVPALLIWCIDILENHRVVEVARYLIFTEAAIFALSAFALSRLFELKKLLLFRCLLLFQLSFALLNLYSCHTVRQREPWQEMAQKVEQLVPPEKTLYIAQPYDIVCLDRYLLKPRKQMGISPAMGKARIESLLEPENEFALLTAQEGESIKELLPPKFQLQEELNLSHGLHLRLYSARIP
ncbi:MAG: glycosyltransferase family 39 protein, partial [Candidatus Obscuribacterales bacterium]|nr:glycosyltransferase family 39 protein [Candidatus Obscuribacterales bacterium]